MDDHRRIQYDDQLHAGPARNQPRYRSARLPGGPAKGPGSSRTTSQPGDAAHCLDLAHQRTQRGKAGAGIATGPGIATEEEQLERSAGTTGAFPAAAATRDLQGTRKRHFEQRRRSRFSPLPDGGVDAGFRNHFRPQRLSRTGNAKLRYLSAWANGSQCRNVYWFQVPRKTEVKTVAISARAACLATGYNLCRSTFATEVLMLSSTNSWMSFAGLLYLVAGIFILRKEISAARGWDKLIALGPVFIAVPLAVFAPEHFRGPEFVQNMVPSWMPGPHWPWAYFVGCALLAAATSLALRKFVRLSATLLGLMFFLFVCMIYLPSALRHPGSRLAWTFMLRDLSFAAGAWALAGLHSRASSPQQSKWMILFARSVIAVAAIFYGAQHFLHPASVPDIPLEKMTPSWVPFPSVRGYLAGAIPLPGGIGLILNKK